MQIAVSIEINRKKAGVLEYLIIKMPLTQCGSRAHVISKSLAFSCYDDSVVEHHGNLLLRYKMHTVDRV